MSDDTATSTADAPIASRQPPRRAALGRGLGALLGETRREEAVVRLTMPDSAGDGPLATPGSPTTTLRDGGLALLAVADIEPHPDQPRRHFDEAALEELAQSIAQRGVIQPVIVRRLASGRYQLVAGERRWRASQRARVHEIPALIRELSDRDVMALALIENLQRKDLNPLEEARAYERLAALEGMSQQDIAKLVDKSRSHVANIMRLLSLPEEVLELVESEALSMGHARALVTLRDPLPIARDAVARGLSVRDVERLAKRADRPDTAPRRARAERDPGNSADLAALENHVEEFLGLKVTITPDANERSGIVTVRYTSLDQLDLICQRLTGGAI